MYFIILKQKQVKKNISNGGSPPTSTSTNKTRSRFNSKIENPIEQSVKHPPLKNVKIEKVYSNFKHV